MVFRIRTALESPSALATLVLIGLAGGLLTQIPMGPGLPGMHHLLVGGSGAAIILALWNRLPEMGREQWQGMLLVGLMLLIGLVSAALSPYWRISLVHTARFVPLIVFGAGLLLLSSRESGRRCVLACVYWYLVALALVGMAEAGSNAMGLDLNLTQYFPQWTSARIASLTQNPNPYGALMVLAVLIWSMRRQDQETAFAWSDLTLLPILWALVASGSRTAWLGFALLCVLLIVFRLRRPAAVALIVGAFVVCILANPVARDRIGLGAVDSGPSTMALLGIEDARAQSADDTGQAGFLQNIPLQSMYHRFELWGHAAQAFLDRPGLGWGYGTYRQELVTEVLHRGYSPHNLELLVLVSTGIVGFALFVAATARVLVSAARAGPHLLVAGLMVLALQQAEEFSYSWAFIMTASALSAVALGAGRRTS